MSIASSWQFWALLSALFAALTAISAKIGVEQIDADLATFIRTLVVVLLLATVLAATGGLQSPAAISGKSWAFLILSGLATGASWWCYFRALKLGQAAQVAPLSTSSAWCWWQSSARSCSARSCRR